MNLRMSLAVVAAWALACGGAITDPVDPAADPAQQGVAVEVWPASASVAPGGTVAFAATVTGTADTSVSWSVEEGPSGGTVSASGFYSAPQTAGSYHVRVASAVDSTKSARATVTVSAAPPPPPPVGGVAAFPGAQGAGTLTKGGRGGAVHEVTKLADDGTAGTLRYCVNQSGPRTCVFRIGGTIELTSPLTVKNPYLTIAGQTAPGGGIALSGKNMSSQVLAFYTHDVVVRYLRIRKGYNAASSGTSQAGQTTAYRTGAYNIVVDHCSISWTQDENVTFWADTTPPRDVTVSWSVVSEPLSDHPTSIISGAGVRSAADLQTDLDFHHNYIANSSHRNPLLKNKRSRFVNNIVYNWKFYATQIGGGGQMDIIGNLYAPGPLTTGGGYSDRHEVQSFPNGSSECATGSPSLHVVGNKGPHNANPDADNWSSMVRQIGGENQSEVGLLSTVYQRATPLAAPASGNDIVPEPVSGLDASVLPGVGAAQQLDCDGTWKGARDAVDTRVVGDYYAGTGRYPARETDAGFGGYPVLAAGTPCADADHDGMPDLWETARGLDPASASDGAQVAPNGYTNLENYLNGQ